MFRWIRFLIVVASIGLCCGTARAAAAPRILELRTQKAGELTYFHVRLEKPADLRFPTFDRTRAFSDADRRNFARLPRLVPQDGRTRAVYYRHKPARIALSFYGQMVNRRKARLLLRYPTKDTPTPKPGGPEAVSRRSSDMVEVAVELDFAKARVVPQPTVDPLDQHIHRNDLRTNWALYQAAHFAVLETQVLDFSFYSFAREATGRKYNVTAPAWVQRKIDEPHRRLYEITTGADALTQTLQLHRILKGTAQGGKRTIPIANLPKITVPPVPWKRLLAGKNPKIETMAGLIPHDNYYLYFRDFSKFLEIGDLTDEWGTNVIRAYELKSRDAGLRQRYEKQLCLKSTVLGKVFGPALIKGLAVTGSDPYVREGTDVTVIFHVVNRRLFLAAVNGFIKEARRTHGRRLVERTEKYQGATIESFVTPLREVSLHRVSLGEFVVYSNSSVGARRVIDANAGRAKRLAESDGFRYMRTKFPANEKAEHGFAFLPDAFIRRLSGPATRIKEKRRLEALTSLSMLTNAALFSAWETGKLPADHDAALAAAGLQPADVAVPEGKAAVWDARQKLAVSNAYNTLHFATPLVELPIDKVTPVEMAEYKRFHRDYTQLWRTYFDPVGMRLTLDKKQVRVETHILPVAGRSRSILGGIDVPIQVSRRSNNIVHFQAGPIGLFLDKTPLVDKMLMLLIHGEGTLSGDLRKTYDQHFWNLPFGITIDKKLKWPVTPDQIIQAFQFIGLVGIEKPQVKKYKGVSYQRIAIAETRYRKLVAEIRKQPVDGPFATLLALLPTQEAPDALYLASSADSIDVSFNEKLIKKRIDENIAAKKPAVLAEKANAVLVVTPHNARAAAGRLLEYESHRLSLLNNDVWNCFYQTGLLKRGADVATANESVRRFLGYVPVSADGSPYQYDPRHAEVVSRRHGTVTQPIRHPRIEANSGPGKLLAAIKSLRVEMSIRNNALNSVLTIERR